MRKILLLSVILSQIIYSNAWSAKESKHWIFGGVDGGLSTLSASNSLESNKTGFHLGVKAFYSHLWDYWILDVGPGWFYNSMTGELNSIKTKVKTNALFLDTNFQYRLTPVVSIGPALQVLFGSDTSFSSVIGSSSVSIFAGLQATYRLPFEQENDFRLTTKVLTDLNIQNRQVWLFMLGVQFGFAVFGESEPVVTPPVEETLVENEPQADSESVLPPPPAVVPQYDEEVPDVKVDLGVSRIWFEFNSTRLEAGAKNSLVKMGGFLQETQDEWSRIKVDGHTDQRGKEEYNLNLSRGRAQSVKAALVQGGVPDDKIEVRAFGESRPLDPQNNEAAWAKNRRVELQFFEVSNPDKVRSKLIEIIDEKN